MIILLKQNDRLFFLLTDLHNFGKQSWSRHPKKSQQHPGSAPVIAQPPIPVFSTCRGGIGQEVRKCVSVCLISNVSPIPMKPKKKSLPRRIIPLTWGRYNSPSKWPKGVEMEVANYGTCEAANSLTHRA